MEVISLDFLESINLEILVQLSANSLGLVDRAGNTWEVHNDIWSAEENDFINQGITWSIQGRFPDTYVIDCNANKWYSCNKTFILPYKEKWFIYLWNYKTDFTDYDVILGGSNAKFYSLQNKDGEYADSIGMRIEGQGYSLKSLAPQETYKWTNYYIDCNGSGTFYLYINGKLQQKLIRNQDIIFKSLNLGSWSYGTCREGTPGFIDELVIIKGERLFYEEFEVPDEPFSFQFFNRNLKKVKRYITTEQSSKYRQFSDMLIQM